MPRVFDNIENGLLPALRDTLKLAYRADFCVGYFNLRGWKALDSGIDAWPGGSGHCCRLLVGMQRLPQDELRTALSPIPRQDSPDSQTALRLKQKLAEEFRQQLTLGAPSNADEAGLRRLVVQLRAGKLRVKLFLRHLLHAKLYLLFRDDPVSPIVGYLGSSNLTLSGLAHQGELNVDVLDYDAGLKLTQWFEDRWADRWCVDISAELAQVIEQSWAREMPLPPYQIYIKMAYHLAQEARAGLAEFRIPPEFGHRLFDYQVAAVKIAAHHLNKRGGVLIGDVVGLGKTLMATALAKIFEDDQGVSTLILCPKNLTALWRSYADQYGLHAKIVPFSKVIKELPTVPARFRLVLIDESHNLRNREGQRFQAIQNYIGESSAKCILLSATPYNKTYTDLSNQLRLFVPEHLDLGIRPERLLRDIGETEFSRRYQCSLRSLAAFEKSEYTEDWRELMRLYMVRRTRHFIQANYTTLDPVSGRPVLTFEDGTHSGFPERIPKTVKFRINDQNPDDHYARFYAPATVSAINDLHLPRYGLGNYIATASRQPPTPSEAKLLEALSRAGKRLMGFCRTNLFKRLESSGEAFQQSVERHILRNYVFLHAIDHGLPLPLGTQDSSLLDAGHYDEDMDDEGAFMEGIEQENEDPTQPPNPRIAHAAADFKQRAALVYQRYAQPLKNRFKWLRPELLTDALRADLNADAMALLTILTGGGEWQAGQDTKLDALFKLVNKTHRGEKVIIFTQFADTVRYLETQLRARGVEQIAGVTGSNADPTVCAWRFSPVSNQKRDQIKPTDELRVLIATDVLSEGQNLQDAAIIVNFDLPWAIIRLIQRAGRVDRIGQQAEKIFCYSFLPADGVERLIRLRARVRERLRENAEVVGTDEAFFEDEREKRKLLDLYHEKAGILDDDADAEVDLISYAYQIWKNAIDRFPALQKTISELPAVVYSTQPHVATKNKPYGVLVYLRTATGNDLLSWVDQNGNSVTESQFEILKAAECTPDTPALARQENHHALVIQGIEAAAAEEKSTGGQLGRPSGARFRSYVRLKRYAEQIQGTLFDLPQLSKVIEAIYRYPLRQSATDTLNRQLRAGMSDEKWVELVMALHDEDRLCIIHEDDYTDEPRIICSMGLAPIPKS
ncbi:helicase-related protein [Candidatus Contendibacter odensensis]|uniref:Helicase domain protein n=1 Tax=Candidatus Contendobacter odensis Run_B_J11 TaxID=1400861 RepID=A0A7U7GF42_9GAMM|nr:helicase-related protein [Candidatus Contendobacter odensis]CDH47230.1 Helicase domain protein [Candidatus Contendobacter odensis Run_B_J11]